MTALKFKTNLKCGGCVSAVQPKLDALENVEKWDVDLASPEKTLTIMGDIEAQEVVQAFEQAGYKAEPQ